MILRCYAVLASVSRCYSTLEGRLVTCYSPGRHFTQGLLPFLVRLACVRHAASVDSEPGSNSRLKPDVCRRVVGRLPSPRSKTRDGATAQLFALADRNPKKFRDRSGLSCEIDRTYARIRFSRLARSTYVVKDRIAVRLSGANSVQAETHECETDCPRNFTSIRCGVYPVNHRFPQNFQMISTAGPFWEAAGELEAALRRATV